MDPVTQGGGGGKLFQRLEGGGADGGSHRVGEQVRTAALAQQVHDLPAGGGVAAGGAAQSLAKGAGQDVDPALHTAELRGAAAGGAHKAHGVAVVHHDQSTELIGQIADALQVGDIAVHGEHTVGGDEHGLTARLAGGGQLGAQIGHVVVFVAEALSLAKTGAVDDGSVVQFVRDDGILRAQQGLEQAAVGVKAGGVKDGVVHAQKFGKLTLQLLVDILSTTDKAHGGQAEAPLVIAGLGRGDQIRVIGEAQIVVGAHVDHLGRGGGVDSGALGSGDNTLVLPGARFLDGGQLLTEFFQFHVGFSFTFFRSSPGLLCRTGRCSWRQSPPGSGCSGSGG